MRTPFLDRDGSSAQAPANSHDHGSGPASLEGIARFGWEPGSEPEPGQPAAAPEPIPSAPGAASVGPDGLEGLPTPRQHDLQLDQLSGAWDRASSEQSSERDRLTVQQPPRARLDPRDSGD